MKRRPSLTRGVLAGLFHLLHNVNAAEVLKFELGTKARRLRKIDDKAAKDLRRAERWIDGMVEREEKRKPGLKRRIGGPA